MIDRLVTAMRQLDPDTTAHDVLDAAWLAAHLRPPPEPAGTRDDAHRGTAPRAEPASGPAPSRSPDPPAGPGTRPPSDAAVAAAGSADDKRDTGGPDPPDRATDVPGSGPVRRGPAGPDGALWLPPAGFRPAEVPSHLPLRTPASPALPGTLALARALRPLRRHLPSRTVTVVDEAATAQRCAETGFAAVVVRPAATRHFDAVLAIDDSDSTAVWRQTAVELRDMLHRLAAFRDVRVWRFGSDAAAGPLTLRPESNGATSSARSPRELLDPAGRRVFLVFSDCVGRGWRTGPVADLLATWGERAPVVIVQPLPQRLWLRCAADASAVRIWSGGIGVPNAHLTLHSPAGVPLRGAGIPVPVVELRPTWLAAWAAVVAGDAAGWQSGGVVFTDELRTGPAVVDPPPDTVRPGGAPDADRRPAAERDGIDPDRDSAEHRWAAFRQTASVQAIKLAIHLAATPLNLATMRLVRSALVPEASTADLAEIFVGGLLRRVSPRTPGEPPDEVRYDFHPGLRELLLAQLPRHEAVLVFAAVCEFVAARLGSPMDFLGLLAEHRTGELADTLGRPFARIAVEVLRAAGGRFAEQADELARLVEQRSPPPAATPAVEPAAVPATPGAHTDRTANVHNETFDPAGADMATDQMPARSPVATQTDTSTAASGDEPQGIWGLIPASNPNFVGREAQLGQLHQSLARESRATVVPQALHGMGGVGKTQLAVEYAHRYGDQYDLVWWISAEQVIHVKASLASLAQRMNLPATEDMDSAVRNVLSVLATRRQRWLLIYDNADDPNDVMPLVPASGAHGHIIITSRNPAWGASGHVASVEVDVLPRVDSVDLLRRRVNGISAAQADELARRLGDLPLALEQAATWISESTMTVEQYLSLLDERTAELLAEGTPVMYHTPATAAVGLALDQLRAASVAAHQLLAMLAYLAAEPVTRSLLAAARNASVRSPLKESLFDPLPLGRLIRQVRRFGLVRATADGTLLIHRLTQTLVREHLSVEERAAARQDAHQFLAAANPAEPDDPTRWPLHAELGVHVIPSDVINADSDTGRRVALDQIRYLYAIGDYESSQRMARLAAARWSERIGADDELTLLVNRHLANTLRAIGETDEARQTDFMILGRMREVLGADHEHALATANSYGADLRNIGRFAEARELDLENVAAHERVFGSDDEATLRTMNNLAVDLRLLGRFKDAYELDNRIIRAHQRNTPAMSPLTLSSIKNLVNDMYGLGDYEEALTTQQRWLPEHRRMLGPTHNNVLLASRNVAIALRKVGRHAEAASWAEENYRAYQHRFGPDHEHTLAATMSYANSLLRLDGQAPEAKKFGAEGLDRYRERFGARHPFTLAAATNYAVILRGLAAFLQLKSPADAAEERRAARELGEQTLPVMEEVLGERHPYTLCCAANTSNDLSLAGDDQAARTVSQRVWDQSVETRGPRHPYTLAAGVNLAADLLATGDEPAGEALLQQVVRDLREVLGVDHPDTIDAERGRRAECDIEPPPS